MEETNQRIYKTKNREIILTWFKMHEGCAVSAAELAHSLEDMAVKISTASLYRNLSKLVSEGSITRSSYRGCPGELYVYKGNHHVCQLTCANCGKVVSVECEEMKSLFGHLNRVEGFQLDCHNTVLTGYCRDCLDTSESNISYRKVL